MRLGYNLDIYSEGIYSYLRLLLHKHDNQNVQSILAMQTLGLNQFALHMHVNLVLYTEQSRSAMYGNGPPAKVGKE